MAPYPNCNIKRIYFFNTNLNYNNIFSRDLYYVASSANSTNEFIINALPETQFGDISKLDEDKKNCIICLEDYKIGDKAISNRDSNCKTHSLFANLNSHRIIWGDENLKNNENNKKMRHENFIIEKKNNFEKRKYK